MDARLRNDPPPPDLPHQGLFDWLDAKHRGLLDWLVNNQPQTFMGFENWHPSQPGPPYQTGPMVGGRIRRPKQRIDDPRLRKWAEKVIMPGYPARIWKYDTENEWHPVDDRNGR